MSLRSIIAQLTARLAVRLHPQLMLRGSAPTFSFVEDGLGTVHNDDFASQPRFQQAYALGKATGSWHDCDLRWRIHVLLWGASWATRLEGAFVECGVYRGGFARAIIDYTNFASLNRDYYLFDTFAGFDEAQLSAAERESVLPAYCYEDCFAAVQRECATMPFVKLVRGAVPASLVDVGPVAFLSIDMNCSAPEIAAARFFWPRLVKGAPILLDDYGFALHREQKRAFDALAAEWGVEILSLPTGQGLIFKP
jgi:hypothetical protein